MEGKLKVKARQSGCRCTWTKVSEQWSTSIDNSVLKAQMVKFKLFKSRHMH